MLHPRAETPTTVPYNPSAKPDVLDIVIARDLVFPVHLTTCSPLSLDHLPILSTRSVYPFVTPDRPDLRTDWPKFQACLGAGLPPNPDLPNEGALDACVKELTITLSKALADSTQSAAHLLTHGPHYRFISRTKYA